MPRTATSLNPTPRFGLIGFPAAHSQSPELFREFCGGRWEYDIIETPSFEEAWDRFVDGPYRAVNVTAPFKEPAFQKADIKSSECQRIKAANILVKTSEGIKAYNSDYLAVLELLKRHSHNLRHFSCQIDSNQTNLDSRQSEQSPSGISIAVIGFGGAGKAAMAAAEDFALPVSSVNLFRHNEISDGVKADIIIYTLPKAVPGIDKLDCSVLIEANYKDPCLSYDLTSTEFNQTRDFGHVRVQTNHFLYVPGTEWLRLQAKLGYPLLVGHPRNG